MNPSKLLLALALLAGPSHALITPLPTKLHVAVTRTTPVVRPSAFPGSSRLAVAGGTTRSLEGEADLGVKEKPLPRELMPITLGVFAQMLGEGISLSSLPLYLTRLGATPTSVGLAISCFSLAQMTFAPVLVGLSSRIGRSVVLRICLAGAIASSLLIAFSGSVCGIIAGRTLAGVFAACVPVAQSGVTDVLDKDQTALGLSRVSAASQLGVVVGPAASAIFQEAFGAMGLAPTRCLPAVFCLTSVFKLCVLILMTLMNRRSGVPASPEAKAVREEEPKQDETTGDRKQEPGVGKKDTVRFGQGMLRTITIAMGWTAILSNSIYGLFAPRFLGFSQPQLSATYSVGAALMVATQVVFPRLVAKFGEYRVCTLGILAAGAGIGGQSLFRSQPFHSALYLANRGGAAVADTSTASLVARLSGTRASCSRNLALLTSTRAASRILTPLLSSKMFEVSCRRGSVLPPGALPFVTAACFAMAVAPLPTLLKRAEHRGSDSSRTNDKHTQSRT